ncbi:MAG: nucleoside-diphosphate kinase [Candidatus Buchananbacteria bacterium]
MRATIDESGRPIINLDDELGRRIYKGKDADGAEIEKDEEGEFVIVDGEKRYWRGIIDPAVAAIDFDDFIDACLVILKPDALQRRLDEEIIGWFMAANLSVKQQKKITFTAPLIYRFYPYFFSFDWEKDLIDYLTSGPSLAFLLAGEDAIEKSMEVKRCVRQTFCHEVDIKPRLINLLHCSDSVADTVRESSLIFPD